MTSAECSEITAWKRGCRSRANMRQFRVAAQAVPPVSLLPGQVGAQWGDGSLHHRSECRTGIIFSKRNRQCRQKGLLALTMNLILFLIGVSTILSI